MPNKSRRRREEERLSTQKWRLDSQISFSTTPTSEGSIFSSKQGESWMSFRFLEGNTSTTPKGGMRDSEKD